MSRNSYLIERITYSSGGSEITTVRDGERFPKIMGRETEIRKTAASCYNCSDCYFLGHSCENKILMVVEEISNQERIVEKMIDEEVTNNKDNPTDTLSIHAIHG